MYTKRSASESLFNKVADLQSRPLSKRHSGTGVFLWTLQKFSEHLQTTASERALNFTTKGPCCYCWQHFEIQLSKEVRTLCFLRSALGRFLDISMETFNKGFSCSWIFCDFWTCKKVVFPRVNCFSFDSCSMLKMFWIITMETWRFQVTSVNKRYLIKITHVNP